MDSQRGSACVVRVPKSGRVIIVINVTGSTIVQTRANEPAHVSEKVMEGKGGVGG